MQVQARTPLPARDSLKGLGAAMSVVLHAVLLMIGLIAASHWDDEPIKMAQPMQAYLVYAPEPATKSIDPPVNPVKARPPEPKQPPKPAKPVAEPQHEAANKPDIALNPKLEAPKTPVRPSTPPIAASPPAANPSPPAANPSPPVPSAAQVTNTAPKINAQYAATNPKPVYPPMAKQLGQQGTVELRILVSEAGTASKVEVLKSSGYGNLDAAAVQAISQWRFEPATQNNKPVAQWLTTRWTYELQN